MKYFNKQFGELFFSISLGCFFLIFSGSASAAQPYQPSAPVEIVTETNSASDEIVPGQMVEWTVVFRNNSADDRLLSFYLSENDQLICQLFFTESGNQVQWLDTKRIPHAITSQDFLIVPGVNVPCDLLPISQISNENSVSYEVKRQVGNQAFIDRLQIESSEVNDQEAVQKGWVQAGTLSAEDRLVMIRAINLRTNEVLVQQLWHPGDDWWIYEETLTRKSWRVR